MIQLVKTIIDLLKPIFHIINLFKHS
ncbi:MAG: hypothetical protein LBT75_03930 [Bacilli bacterium]|nr:hypothetical protein [Bacilli bacterium]